MDLSLLMQHWWGKNQPFLLGNGELEMLHDMLLALACRKPPVFKPSGEVIFGWDAAVGRQARR